MEITRSLMSTKDMLELEMISMDYLIPAIRDCYTNMQRYPALPASFEGLRTLEGWHKKLSGMKVSDTLAPEEVKQLKFDLGNIFDAFSALIQN